MPPPNRYAVTLAEFKSSLANSSPPPVGDALVALWYDGKGEWEAAHNVAQDISSDTGSWIHAYLHRKEGDNSNAQYWYALAHKKMPQVTLDMEWENIVMALLEH